MTAADALLVQPAPRPEPAAPKAATPGRAGGERDDKSFADVLDAETSNVDDSVSDAVTNEELVSEEAGVALAQPAPPPVAPAATSPAAILAGLAPQAPVVQEEATPAPADAAMGPKIAGGAPGAGDATDSPELQAQLQSAELLAGAVPAAPAKAPTTLPAKPAGRAVAPGDDESGVTLDDGQGQGQAKAAAPLLGVQPVLTPAPMSETLENASNTGAAVGPGGERAAAAIEASAPKAAPAKSASASTDLNGQATSAKMAQASTAGSEGAPEIKISPTSDGAVSPAPGATPAAANAATETSKTAQAGQAGQAVAPPPGATVQVYTRMIDRFDGRAQRYEIRLDPEELGRVDVRIEVGADKKVHAVLAAHDSAALSDLMRGQRSLETALRQAGVDVADGGIKFELSSENGRGQSNGADQGDTSGNRNGFNHAWRGFSPVNIALDADTAAAARPWRTSRLDLVA